MEDQAKYFELGVTSLVNAGRWEEAEEFALRYPEGLGSAHASLAYGTALSQLQKWEEAADVFALACENHPDHASLRAKYAEAQLQVVNLRMKRQQWEEMEEALARLIATDPDNPEAQSLQTTLEQAGVMTKLIRGRREEAAKEWECQLAENKSPDVAHCLAVLYYWSALQQSSQGDEAAPITWQKAIACWSFVAHHPIYLAKWRMVKERTYPIGEALMPDIVQHIRQDLMDRIDTAEAENPGIFSKVAEDLRRDLWIEWETAEAILRGGGSTPCGPLLMSLVGNPEKVYTSAESFGKKGLILGKVELPFLKSVDHLTHLCRLGYGRIISYLADGELEISERLIRDRQTERSDSEADGMLAYLALKRIHQDYVALPCPPNRCAFEEIRAYSSTIHGMLDRLKALNIGDTTSGIQKMLEEITILFCRRTRNEFENFEPDPQIRAHFTETGASIVEKALSLQDVEEGRLELALMFNRLALQQDKNSYDAMVSLFEKAHELAPDHPLYRRNLAFSYFNRYQKRRFFDSVGAAEDIALAFQLEPYDDDIRTAHVQMCGRKQ